MKYLLIALLLSSCSISKSIPDNPKNIQVKVIEIISNKNNLVKCKGISTTGDSVYLDYIWRGWRSKNRAINVGTLIYAMGSFEVTIYLLDHGLFPFQRLSLRAFLKKYGGQPPVVFVSSFFSFFTFFITSPISTPSKAS